MKLLKNITIFVTIALLASCFQPDTNTRHLKLFKEYFKTLKNNHEKKWDYTADTVKVWFDKKEGKPNIQVKGEKPTGKWKEWDQEMHSSSRFDSIWYNEKENAVQGYFYENNDFYQLIGRAPNKTVRTYWFNKDDKIYGILIYLIPGENKPTSTYLRPVVEWAKKNYPGEIMEIYPGGEIIPSKENAIKWKKLLKAYNARKGTTEGR